MANFAKQKRVGYSAINCGSKEPYFMIIGYDSMKLGTKKSFLKIFGFAIIVYFSVVVFYAGKMIFFRIPRQKETERRSEKIEENNQSRKKTG